MSNYRSNSEWKLAIPTFTVISHLSHAAEKLLWKPTINYTLDKSLSKITLKISTKLSSQYCLSRIKNQKLTFLFNLNNPMRPC